MKIISFALFTSLVFSRCSSDTYERLSFQKKEVTVDGNISEWPNPLKYFDAKSKLNFTISNDRQNLYVCIKAADDQSQLKILRGGMDFSIDTASKKTFPITVTYPLPRGERMKPGEARGGRHNDGGEQSDISRKEAILENCKTMRLAGFSIPITDNVPLINPYGIVAAMAIDKNDVMVYELIIPFKTFYKEELSPADSNKVFTYQVKVRGITMEQSQHAGGGGGSRGGGGMGGGGGMSGSGMGRGGGGGGKRGGAGGGAMAANPLAEADVLRFKAKFSYR